MRQNCQKFREIAQQFFLVSFVKNFVKLHNIFFGEFCQKFRFFGELKYFLIYTFIACSIEIWLHQIEENILSYQYL